MKLTKANTTKGKSQKTMREEGAEKFRFKSKPKTDEIPKPPVNKQDLEIGKVYNMKGILKMWNGRQWRKVCTVEFCGRHAVTKGFCKAHGGGLRCSHITEQPNGTTVICPHSAVDKLLLCKQHGGGRRCLFNGQGGCDKSAAGNTDMCKAHGGGVRCSVVGCHNSGVSPSPLCIKHGGGMRCSFAWRAIDGAKKGRTERSDAGVAPRPPVAVAAAVAAAAAAGADVDISFCKNSARGGTGFCVRHCELGQCVAMMCLKDKTDMTDRSVKFCEEHTKLHYRYGALGILGDTAPTRTAAACIVKTVRRKKRAASATGASSSSSSSSSTSSSFAPAKTQLRTLSPMPPSISSTVSASSSSLHSQSHALPSSASREVPVSASMYVPQYGTPAPLPDAGSSSGAKRARAQPPIGDNASEAAMFHQQQHLKRLREQGHFLPPQFAAPPYPYPMYQTYPAGPYPLAPGWPPVAPRMSFGASPFAHMPGHPGPYQFQQQQAARHPHYAAPYPGVYMPPGPMSATVRETSDGSLWMRVGGSANM